ncbi:helix-turn-helix domain-containing protein [Chryseolinea soli]|nr:helix-turn-helix transcriptional regulator [Chryseolinea soli]
MRKTTKKYRESLIHIGAALSSLRQMKGYTTVKEFASRYKLPVIQYWRIERGKANLTLKSLARILDIHKLSVQDFFCLMTGHELAMT